MASLIRPLNRCLANIQPLKQMTSGAFIRFKSTTAPSKPAMDANVEKRTTVDPHEDPKESYFPDPWDLMYGAEKFEVAMKQAGYNDPYDSEPLLINSKSTREQPNIVYSLEPERTIGCICEEDTHHITYTTLSMNECKRCECGHWFKLRPRVLPDLSAYGVKFEEHH